MRLVTCLAASVLLLGGCSGGSPATSTLASAAVDGASPVPSASAAPVASTLDAPPAVGSSPTTVASSAAARRCPNPEVGLGNECLGPVAAGTYTTQLFSPTLTYTVPDGWANLEDTAGNFLLLPPGSELTGVNTGASDYPGVYTYVVAPERCTGRYDPNVKRTFDGLLAWLKADPAITLTNVHEVTV